MKKNNLFGLLIYFLSTTVQTGCKEDTKPTKENAEEFGMKIFGLIQRKDYGELNDYLPDEVVLEEIAFSAEGSGSHEMSRKDSESMRMGLTQNFISGMKDFRQALLNQGIDLKRVSKITCNAHLENQMNLTTATIRLEVERSGTPIGKIAFEMAVFYSGEWWLIYAPVWEVV